MTVLSPNATFLSGIIPFCAVVTINPQQTDHPGRIHSHKVEGIIFTHRFGVFQLILHV